MSDSDINTSDTDSLKSNSMNRNCEVRTFVISIPKDNTNKINKLNKLIGSVKELDINDDIKQIEIHIENVEKQAVIINDVYCSKCCIGFNLNIFSKNKASVKTGDNKISVI
tara:strand:- start:61 stop:393 length:333 start_codon:yes stop_codon:yes gene_type:complete